MPHRTSFGAETATVPGFLRGYRGWSMTRDLKFLGFFKTKLNAFNYPWTWTRGPTVATCMRDTHTYIWEAGAWEQLQDPHAAPYPTCSCGYYATYSPSDYRPYVGTGVLLGRAHGSIKAFGRISLGTIGFRAQYAQVESLWGFGTRAAARHYGVPWFRTEAKMLAKFPPQDVTELLQ